MTTVSSDRRDSMTIRTRSSASSTLDDRLVLEVAATLRCELVLDLYGGRPGRLDLDDGSPDVQGTAESGVDVDDHGEVDGGGDPTRCARDVAETEQSEVGFAERGRREREPGEVDGVETGLLDQHRLERIGTSRRLDEPALHRLAEPSAVHWGRR